MLGCSDQLITFKIIKKGARLFFKWFQTELLTSLHKVLLMLNVLLVQCQGTLQITTKVGFSEGKEKERNAAKNLHFYNCKQYPTHTDLGKASL